MSKMKIAGYQMTVTSDIHSNFHKICKAIEESADNGCDLLVIPECALSGYPPLHYSDVKVIDVAAIAELNNKVCEKARDNKIWVILGTILTSPNGLVNSALLISPEGKITSQHDKLHLMPDDKRFFTAGNILKPTEINGICCGILICYDVRFPEPYRILRESGAKVFITILNACGGETWKLPVMEGAFRSRAAENTAFMAAINAAGPLQMAVSRIVNPLGLDLASANQDNDEIIFAEIDIDLTDNGYYYDRRTDLFNIKYSYLEETD